MKSKRVRFARPSLWFVVLSQRNGNPLRGNQAIQEIARKTKETRDAGFVETEEVKGKDLTVNRCESIASLGGSQQNSEEEYLILKMMRALGIVAIDNQARV